MQNHSDSGDDLDMAGSDAAPEAARRLELTASGGGRVDRELAEAGQHHALSRSRIKELILAGHLAVDGQPCRDPARKIAAGQHLALALPEPEPAEPAPEAIPLAIAYEDADLIVVDKPAGMVVHPAAGHAGGTLVNALLAHCAGTLSGIGGVLRPGIVHRLDKDTSGLLVVAKNDRAHRHLAAQFADHGRSGPLEREYRAIGWGVPSRPHGTIDANLQRSEQNREKIAVVPQSRGRHAVTHYEVLEHLPGGHPVASLLACQLETGRTHQIRVHLASLGHPLLGDMLYGSGFLTKAGLLSPAAAGALTALGRQALHAAVLGFEHPRTGEHLRFESPLPADFAELLAALRQSGPARS